MPSGHEHAGVLNASNEAAAREELALQGLLVLEFTSAPKSWTLHSGLSASDLALGLRMLADLVDCGMPMSDALATFSDLAPASWLAALPQIVQEVTAGGSLPHALEAAVQLRIPGTVIGLIRAGEAGSGLGSGMHEAAVWAEARSANKAALKNAFTYPAIVAAVGAASIVVMVGVVLPRFSQMLSELDQAPPRLTILIMHGADLARAAFVPLVVAGLAIVGWLRVTYARNTGRRLLQDFVLRIPVIGAIRFASVSSRTLASLGSLLASGVPVSAAIQLAGQACGDAAVESRMRATGELVVTGQSLARSMTSTKAAPPAALRLIAVGEESGRLAKMLTHAAQIEGARAAAMTRQLLRIVEPMLLLAVSATVAVIATAMLQAVYSIRPAA